MPLSGRLRALFWQVPTGCEVPFNFLFDWLPWAPCYKPGFVLVVVLWALSSFSSSILEVWVQVWNLTLPSAVPAQDPKITGPLLVRDIPVCGARHHGAALQAHLRLIMPLTSASPVGLACLKSFHAPVSLICQASLKSFWCIFFFFILKGVLVQPFSLYQPHVKNLNKTESC